MRKWRNFSFRNTSAASSTWDGGAIIYTSQPAGWDSTVNYASGASVQWNGRTYTSAIANNLNHQPTGASDANWTLVAECDPNDANNVTTVVLPPVPAYPTLSADAIHYFGNTNGASTTGTDLSKTNAGGNALLAGYHTAGSINQAFQFDCDNGGYDVRVAMGPTTSARAACLIVDGSFSGFKSDIGVGGTLSVKLWSSATAFASGDLAASHVDGTLWKANASGTSGSTEPSGTGPSFNDGGIIWTKQARSFLAVVDYPAGTSGGSSVIDTSNSTVAAASWGSNMLSLTVTRGALTLMRTSTAGLYCRQFSIRAQPVPLADVTLRDETGVTDPGSSPTVYANQPSGYKTFKVVATAGASAASNFSLTGSLASYFNLQTFNTSEVWLVANSLLLPDTLAGPQTLNIVQTDPDATGSPHTTSFTPTVVSSMDRPTAVLSKVTTQTWLARKAIKDQLVNIWPGYTGQSFVRDTLVTNGTALASELNTLAALPPNLTSWYRIRLGAGTYTGLQNNPLILDFGSGGLLIEPDSGADPEFNMSYSKLQVHGLHIRNLKIPNDVTQFGGAYQFIFSDPGSTGINGNGRFNRVKMTGCRVGILYGAGNVLSDWSTKAGSLTFFYHGESFEFTSNTVKCTKAVNLLEGVHWMRVTDNDYQLMVGDILGPMIVNTPSSTIGVFSDNNIYCEFARNTVWNEPDYSGYSNGKHPDTIQIYRSSYDSLAWAPSTAYTAGTHVVNGSSPWRIYVCTTPGTSAASGGPSGTGSSIADGTVVWQYVADQPPGDIYVLDEENTVSSEGPVSGQNGRQCFLDSNSHHGNKVFLTAINNVHGSTSTYGLAIGDGAINAEFNTFASSAQLNSGDSILGAKIQAFDGGAIRSFHNVVRAAATSGSGTVAASDEATLDWSATAVSPNRPGDYLAGSFSQDATSRWTYPTLVDDGSVPASSFKAQMRGILIAQSGKTAGIQS